MQLKDFKTLTTEQAANIQGASTNALVDFSVGSILRAIVEAYVSVALWLQGLVLQLLATTRASTSTGTDLDTWVGDFGLSRLAAVAASGQVLFSRFTATAQTVVPIGSKVQTADGSQQYLVMVDTGNSAYSAGLGGYVMAPGTASVSVPVVATVAGYAGNAAVGGVSTLGQAIIGVDKATNAAAFSNGFDAEADAALRARFVLWINSLAEGTVAAVKAAVAGVQQGLSYSVLENRQYNGTTQQGYFTVIVDDGTGYPTSTLLTAVGNAVEPIRPLGSTFSVHAPLIAGATVAMTILTAAGYTHTTVVAQVAAAIQVYINTLPVGQTLAYTKLAQLAYATSAGVSEVLPSYTLNGGYSDLTATAVTAIKATSVTVA